MKKEHRLGVSEVSLVVRRLKLEDPDQSPIGTAMDEINQNYGVDCVFFDDRSAVLNITYDASRVCIDCLEEVLKKHGVIVSHWTRFKEGYYRFVDQNVKENAKRQP